ncbi:MAG TPA: universal stress protein [Candidatus Acidoferrum sp.]|nr:universal stress protein [Candidatus Acidoferrum sp.]
MFATQIQKKLETPIPIPKRMTFQNILFATDFCPAAQAALPYAAEVAQGFGANLYILHVQEPNLYGLPYEIWLHIKEEGEVQARKLRGVIHQEFPEMPLNVLEAEGDVCSTVAMVVDKFAIDLVIVGTRGRTGLEKALLGSKAEEILRKTACPVLTVGPLVKEKTGERGKFSSILFATQFGTSSAAAARIAVSLAEEFQSKLTLLAVMKNHKEPFVRMENEFGEMSERRLREMVPEEANFWCAPHFLVEQGAPADRILEVADRTEADLIVLGAHAEGMSGAATHLPMTTIHQIVARANCPVLTVRG